jgi:hypothetical protein
MSKSFLKIWNGECSFQAIETFGSLDAASKKIVPSTAAKIKVSNNSIRYQHSTIKEVKPDGNNTLSTPGNKDPGERKGEKKVER